jgi:hypothetical protein
VWRAQGTGAVLPLITTKFWIHMSCGQLLYLGVYLKSLAALKNKNILNSYEISAPHGGR